jgi:hypothetical protein
VLNRVEEGLANIGFLFYRILRGLRYATVYLTSSLNLSSSD